MSDVKPLHYVLHGKRKIFKKFFSVALARFFAFGADFVFSLHTKFNCYFRKLGVDQQEIGPCTFKRSVVFSWCVNFVRSFTFSSFVTCFHFFSCWFLKTQTNEKNFKAAIFKILSLIDDFVFRTSLKNWTSFPTLLFRKEKKEKWKATFVFYCFFLGSNTKNFIKRNNICFQTLTFFLNNYRCNCGYLWV